MIFQGTANPTFQPVPPVSGTLGPSQTQLGSAAGPRTPHTAPTAAPLGFMPMTNAGAPQRPTLGSMPPSPTHSAPVQTAVNPPAPPPTIQTVDTSNVPGTISFPDSFLPLSKL